MLCTYTINSTLTATLVLTSTSRVSRYRSVRSPCSPVRHHKQSTPISRVRASISRNSTANGTTVILVELPYGLPPSSNTAGSIKNTLLPPPVGSTTISNSLRTPLSFSPTIFIIISRYCSDFYYVAGLYNARNPASILVIPVYEQPYISYAP